MDLLWEKFQWILPLYLKPISFQWKASFVCSVTTTIFIDFCLKKLNVFSQHIGKKNKWISEFCRTNPQELKCWSTLCVNYFLRYYLMMHYNMVGVAITMVISTMHEKSCIDSHNAQKFEKSSKNQSFTHLAITMMKVRKYHSHDFVKLS